jgi:hypothetical protein
MKQFFLRSGITLAVLAGLASCGGDDGEIQIPVFITGVSEAGLKLKLNDNPEHDIGASGTYYFPELIPVDGSYKVTKSGRPGNVALDTDCVLTNPEGRVSTVGPNNITLSCKIITYKLGGTVAGLTTTGLVVANGSNQKAIAANATSYDMSVTTTTTGTDGTVTTVVTGSPKGAKYSIQILKQPTGQVCSLSSANGTGEMPAADVTNINITCS